jgi:predicted 3-demethylubiquinone-9 3-methyltransferase (glyoxalase superfamily)
MDGPGAHAYTFNEAVSLVVNCDTQDEIDDYWNKLTNGGQESQCGWLKDRFGVSWQIVPAILGKLMNDPERAPRVMQALMKMKKFDIDTLLNA